jgi:UDP-GlcNAc:undecaprenyl-phosphate GlcNAc-1-phosphate transferase
MNDFIPIPWWPLLAVFIPAFLVTGLGTPLVVKWANKIQLFDMPSFRRLHTSPTPRIGGVILFLSILLVLLFAFGFDPKFFGVVLGLIIIFGTGLLDDLYQLPPFTKLMGQMLAASVVIFFGITITNVTNPFGGEFLLSPWLDVILTGAWILLVINALNWLDGMDGLAAGVTAIGSLVIAVLSLYAFINQPDTAMLALIVGGAALGFLVHNWHPAKIFMGDSGSHVLGFMLATMSIISGGKLATAVLVLGLPIIDLIWSTLRRIMKGQAPWSADMGHLHHLFLSSGLGQRQTVLIYYALTAGFGVVALLTATVSKMIALLIMVVIVASIICFLVVRRREIHP